MVCYYFALIAMYAKCGEFGKAEIVHYQRGKDALKCLEVIHCDYLYLESMWCPWGISKG